MGLLLAGVILLSGCAPGESRVDETLTIAEAKSETQAVEQRIIELVPPEFVVEVKQLPEGILLSCSPDSVTWAGDGVITVQGSPDFAAILAEMQTSFDAESDFTTEIETDHYGDPKLSITSSAHALWIVGPMKHGAILDISSFSPCFATSENVQPRDSY